MIRPRIRLSTVMLLVLIVALAIGYGVQTFRLYQVERERTQARHAEALARYTAEKQRVEAVALMEQMTAVNRQSDQASKSSP